MKTSSHCLMSELTQPFLFSIASPLIEKNSLLQEHIFNELQRFLGEIETDNLTVSNSEIITFDFTVSKK